MVTLYTFGDSITYHKTESVHFSGLMNSATKLFIGFGVLSFGFRASALPQGSMYPK